MEEKKKLGMYIKFDSDKDKDLIELVERLGEYRQLGKFIVNSMRLVNANSKLRQIALSDIALEETEISLYNRANSAIKILLDNEEKIMDKAVELTVIADTLEKVCVDRDKALELLKRQMIMRKYKKDLEDLMGIEDTSSTLAEEIQEKEGQIEEYAGLVVGTILENYSSLLQSSTTMIAQPQMIANMGIPASELINKLNKNNSNDLIAKNDSLGADVEAIMKESRANKGSKASTSFFGEE